MQNEKQERRSFLKHILAGSAVLAGTAAVTKSASAGTPGKKTTSDEILYTESEAFKKYYKSTR